MSQTLAVDDLSVDGYILSITSRATDDTTREQLEELTYRTIKSWLWIVESGLEKGIYTLPLDNGQPIGSVEERYAAELNKAAQDTDGPKSEPFAFKETFGDSRVTVWATFRSSAKTRFHLNSDDKPQVAVDTWLANFRARARIEAEHKPQNATQNAQEAVTAAAAQQQAEKPATPKNAPVAPNSAPSQGEAEPLYTKKDALAKLQPGDKFRMKIVQIEKHSKDGADFYEFYEPYGGKAGQYSAASVFVDNEVALNNGLISYLNSLGVKLGQALTGDWVTHCSVGKPKTKTIKGEEKTFTNIYVNSFEGQELGDLA